MQSSKGLEYVIDEPSETNLWPKFNVKELICNSFGSYGTNVVNLKMVQVILHLLARQLNMLEQLVDFNEDAIIKKVNELKEQQKQLIAKLSGMSSEDSSSSFVSSTEDDDQSRKHKTGKRKKGKIDHKSADVTESQDVEKKKRDRKATKSKTKEFLDAVSGSRVSKGHKDKVNKLKQKKTIDDFATSDRSENDKTETSKTRTDDMSITSKKSYKWDAGIRPISDEDNDEISVKKNKERVTKYKTGRKTDGSPMSGESEDEESHSGKKKADKLAMKSKKRQTADGEPVLDESEDDNVISSTKSKKMATKSEKGRKADSTLISDDSVDGSHKSTKKRKDRIEDKSKKIRTAEGSQISNKSEHHKKEKGKRSKIRDISEDELSLDESDHDDVAYKKRKDKLRARSKTSEKDGSVRSHARKSLPGTRSGSKHKDVQRHTSSRQSSIQLATMSDFKLLELHVQKLKQQTGQVPLPTWPDNKKLIDDLTTGSTTLPATIEVMQVNARVKAAEEGLARMTGLLGQLAKAGIFPQETVILIDQLQQDHEARLTGAGRDRGRATPSREAKKGVDKATSQDDKSYKSEAIDAMSTTEKTALQGPMWSIDEDTDGKAESPSAIFGLSNTALQGGATFLPDIEPDSLVTYADMSDAMNVLTKDIAKHMKPLTEKAALSVDRANSMARAIAGTLETALDVNKRIDELTGFIQDYAAQLSGFDSGMNTQLVSLSEQIGHMQAELNEGLALFDLSDKFETAGVIELRKGYEVMNNCINYTMQAETDLTEKQKHFVEELKNLLENVEILRGQKADRDEVADGLRDKVDISRLRGIPNDRAFEASRNDISERINMCYEKFEHQNATWERVIADLREIISNKAEEEELVSLDSYADRNIHELLAKLHKIEVALGVPKTALMIKHIKSGVPGTLPTASAVAGPSNKHPSHPTPSPALTEREEADGEVPCLTLNIPDGREHVCKRWVGGSHTMVTEHTTHGQMLSTPFEKTCARNYLSLGTDGRQYMLEDELQECIECNDILAQLHEDNIPEKIEPIAIEVGGGDQKPTEEKYDMKVKIND